MYDIYIYIYICLHVCSVWGEFDGRLLDVRIGRLPLRTAFRGLEVSLRDVLGTVGARDGVVLVVVEKIQNICV